MTKGREDCSMKQQPHKCKKVTTLSESEPVLSEDEGDPDDLCSNDAASRRSHQTLWLYLRGSSGRNNRMITSVTIRWSMVKIKGTGKRAVQHRSEHVREEYCALSSFLSFLAADMARSPEKIQPLDSAVSRRIKHLVKDLQNSPEEDLGDEALI